MEILFQCWNLDLVLNPELTGRENIYLNGAILGYSKEFLESKYDEIVAFSELGEFINMPIRNYSSGMMMRLAFFG